MPPSTTALRAIIRRGILLLFFLFAAMPTLAQETAVQMLLAPQTNDETPFVNDESYPRLELTLAPANHGRVPFSGLDATHFTLIEAGETYLPLAVEPLNNPQQPISLLIVLDNSSPMQPIFSDVRTAVINSYNILELTDQSGLLAFETAVNLDEPFPQLNPQRELTFTNDEGALINLLNSLTPTENSATPLYDALLKGVRLAETAAPSERRGVLLITNGLDQTAGSSGLGSTRAKPDTIIQIARTQNIPLFSLGIGSAVDSTLLQDMANQTGGKFFALGDANGITPAISEVVQQMKQSYRLVYDATTEADNGLHDLQIVAQTPQGPAEATVSFKAYYPIAPALHGVTVVMEDGTSYPAEGAPPLLGDVIITPNLVAREGLTAVAYYLNDTLIHQAASPRWEFIWQTDGLDSTIPYRLTIEATTTDQQTARFDTNFILQPCDTFCRWERQLGFSPAYLFLGLGLVILGIFIWLLLRQRRPADVPHSTGSDLFPREKPFNVYNPTIMPPSQPTELDPLLTEYNSQEIEDWSRAGGNGLDHHTSHTKVDKTEVKKPERPLFPKTELLIRSLKHTAQLTDSENGTPYELGPATTIGRAPDNDIVIAEAAVSGYHAKIILQDENFVFADLKVTNPTLINGQEIINQNHTLADGDEIIIGRRTLTFKQLS